ncbi:hypothetical protein I552_1597 [Mycobacterium xenopi 3993]|nr:hypothetical protein I552_1597 [Mycobacterium xenopi 3993]
MRYPVGRHGEGGRQFGRPPLSTGTFWLSRCWPCPTITGATPWLNPRDRQPIS